MLNHVCLELLRVRFTENSSPVTDSEAYYQVNVAIPFINHVIMELDEKFSNLASFAGNILGLVPSVLRSGQFNAIGKQIYRRSSIPRLFRTINLLLGEWI